MMSRLSLSAGLIALAGLVSAQGLLSNKNPAVLLDGVAAYVNSEMITIGEVMSEVRRSPWADTAPELREKRLRELYAATLNALIDRKLILAAAQKSKMELQSWAVDNRIREIVANNFDGDQTKLHDLLADRKISFEEWKKNIEEDLLITAMRYQQVEKRVAPTPSEVRAEYEANKGRYQTETATAVSMIILDPPAQEGDESVEVRAAKIAKALKEGTSFASLAKTYSTDPGSKDQGGDLGWFPQGAMVPEFEEAAFALKPGETSQAVQTSFGYHIIRVEAREVRPLQEPLASQIQQQNFMEWLNGERSKAKVERLYTASPTAQP